MNQDDEYKALCSRSFLSRLRGRRMKIDALRVEIDSYRHLIDVISPDIARRLSPSRSAERRAENSLIAIERLVDIYELELNEFLREIEEGHAIVNRLEPPWSEALRLHYLIGKPWREVAVLLSYSDRYIYTIHHSALIKLFDKLPLEWLAEYEGSLPKAL